jgi:hypothetical protein
MQRRNLVMYNMVVTGKLRRRIPEIKTPAD